MPFYSLAKSWMPNLQIGPSVQAASSRVAVCYIAVTISLEDTPLG